MPVNMNYCYPFYEEQCSNISGKHNNDHLRDACALDCSGELTDGCTLVEEWHLPYIGAEVVCIPDSISSENQDNDNGDLYLPANIELSNIEFSHVSKEGNFDQMQIAKNAKSKFEISDIITYTTKTVAEVTCAKNEIVQMPILNGRSFHSPNPSLLRRCSYEEVVHVENETDDEVNEMSLPPTSQRTRIQTKAGDEGNSDKPDSTEDHLNAMRRCLIRLTQWALTLQEVYEDRETSGLLQPEHFNCNCVRALDINNHLSQLEADYVKAIEEQDRALEERAEANWNTFIEKIGSQ